MPCIASLSRNCTVFVCSSVECVETNGSQPLLAVFVFHNNAEVFLCRIGLVTHFSGVDD